jgi:hypothetical protein
LHGDKYVNALRQAAIENIEPLEQALQAIAEEIPGVHVYASRVKDMDGLLDKIEAKGRPPNTISDYLGARVIADTPQAVADFVAKLHETGGVLEDENFLVGPGKAGYRAHHLQIALGDGTSAELQIVPKPVADVMKAVHELRQPVKRILDDRNASAEDTAKAQAVMAQGKAIFDDAWAKAPEWSSPPEVTPRPIPSPIANGVVTLSPDELLIDASRFQFKEGGDQFGVTDRLKGVKQWDPIKAGMVLVWEDQVGNRFLVDGHQRVGLAKRIQSEDPNQKPMLNGWVIREADGVTDADARVIAATKNIAEGTGTAIDAAKVLRDRPDLLNTLPPRSELVRQARNLANLDPDAFRMVTNEIVPANQAAIVGALAPTDGKMQMVLLDLLSKTEPENVTQAESIVRQGLEVGTTKEVQHTLFGEEEVAKNLYFERAKVLDRALSTIRRDKAIFSTLVKERETIEATGSQLAHDVNERRANADAQAVQILQTLANRKGPIGDALNFAARQAKHDGKYANAVRTFVDAVRREAESGDLARIADGERRSLDHVGAEGGPSATDRIPAHNAPVGEAEKVLELFQRRNLAEERESMGQMAFPGTERLSDAELAQRHASLPLRPTAPQEAPTGLFGEAARQVELALPPKSETPTLEAGGVNGVPSQGVREGAPGVPGEQPAGRAVGASPIRRPRQLSLFGGGGSEPGVRPPDVESPALGGGEEAAVPRPGEGVTSPPALGSGANTPRPDKPAVVRTVKDTEDRIAERSRSNYRITPQDHVGEGRPKEKVSANLEAIRVLKAIEDEARGPTAEEKAKLVKYTG